MLNNEDHFFTYTYFDKIWASVYSQIFHFKISAHLNRTQETKINCDEETCKNNDDQKSFKEIENIPQDSKPNHDTMEERRGGKFPKKYINFNKSKLKFRLRVLRYE